LISDTPSTLVKALRTEAAQLPQCIFGTLSFTSVTFADDSESDVSLAALAGSDVFATGLVADCELQPIQVAAAAATMSAKANRFIQTLQNENNSFATCKRN
jgi:hypothetical protein